MAPQRVCYNGTKPCLFGASTVRSVTGSSFLSRNRWACHPLIVRSLSRSISVGPVCLFGFGRKRKRQPASTTKIEKNYEEKYGEKKSVVGTTGEPFGNDNQKISRVLDVDSASLSNDVVPSIPSTRENDSNVSQETSRPKVYGTGGQDSESSDGTILLPWWSRIPYVCVLNLRSSGRLFMLDTGLKDEEEPSIIAFEDPREANIVKTSLSKGRASRLNIFRQDRKSLFRDLGIKPDEPSDWDSIVELTWLTPTEFTSVLEKSTLPGKVVPAGTLMDMPDRVKNVRKLINEIKQACNETDDGIIEGSASRGADFIKQVEKLQGLGSVDNSADTKPLEPSGGNVDSAEGVGSTDPLAAAKEEATPLISPRQVQSENIQQEIPTFSMNGEHSKEQSSDELPKPSTSRVSSAGKSWWTDITQLYIPQAKQAGNPGGAVEINFAVIPDYTDYRIVVFEDMQDARQFLGVFGMMLGKEARVRVHPQTPEDFVSTTDAMKLKSTVALGKGTLQVSQEMSYQQLVGAVRFAAQATLRKHGEKLEDNIPQEIVEQVGMNEDEINSSLKSAAESMVSAVEEISKNPDQNMGKENHHSNQEPYSFEEIAKKEQDISNSLDKAIIDSISNTRTKPNSDGSSMPQEVNNEEAVAFSEPEKEPRSSVEWVGPEPDAQKPATNGVASDISSSFPTTSETFSDAKVPLSDPHKTEAKEEEEGDDEGTKVYYPPDWSKNSQGNPEGPLWFLKLPVVYLPRYEDKYGEINILAFKASDEGSPLVLGFQDRNDAHHCAEIIGEWKEHRDRPSSVVPVPPDILMGWCQQESPQVDPVILRKGSMPLTSGMDRDEFVSIAGMFAMVQRGNFSGFHK